MKKKVNRDVIKDVSRSVFIAKLRRLADALESNKSFTIQLKNDRLYIPVDPILSIEHERNGKQEELELQISWERK